MSGHWCSDEGDGCDAHGWGLWGTGVGAFLNASLVIAVKPENAGNVLHASSTLSSRPLLGKEPQDGYFV